MINLTVNHLKALSLRMLKNLNLNSVYNSEYDNILNDFYIPALSNSILYCRAVGYFDAKLITSAARGVASFIANSGKMRLIVGATLDEDSYYAILEGYKVKEILKNKIFTPLGEECDKLFTFEIFKNQFNALTWLICNDFLEIKIAIRAGNIYHEKIGFFKDSEGDIVVFQGSSNETSMGICYNYESINVFKGWLPELESHYLPHQKNFERLWEDKAKNTKVIEINDLAMDFFLQRNGKPILPSIEKEIMLWQDQLKKDNEYDSNISIVKNKGPFLPKHIGIHKFLLKNYQLEALKKWGENKYTGILELATGAGKTITSISGAVQLFSYIGKMFLIISVPYINLANQWVEVLKNFNIFPIPCFEAKEKWLSKVQDRVKDFNLGMLNFVCLVVVEKTMTQENNFFLNEINKIKPNLTEFVLFIGDECHHHATQKTFAALPKIADKRLGLSATPFDDEEFENEKMDITKFYGEVVFRYSMSDALNDKVLTPYYYKVIPVYLTDEEQSDYALITQKISSILNNKSIEQKSILNSLSRKRNKIINGATNKYIALDRILADFNKPTKHTLFYCAEGESIYEELVDSHINKVAGILQNRSWKSSPFTSQEETFEREQIMQNFKFGHIDALIAMRCLDEGIDVPVCSTAFILASSKSNRQFIQRRGRILRKYPGKDYAYIYDFLVLPNASFEENTFSRNIVKAELKRINEFTKLSVNKIDTYNELKNIVKKYDLTYILD